MVRSGLLCFKDSTVPAYLVLEYLAKGWDVKDLKTIYPSVKQRYVLKLLTDLSDQLKDTL